MTEVEDSIEVIEESNHSLLDATMGDQVSDPGLKLAVNPVEGRANAVAGNDASRPIQSSAQEHDENPVPEIKPPLFEDSVRKGLRTWKRILPTGEKV